MCFAVSFVDIWKMLHLVCTIIRTGHQCQETAAWSPHKKITRPLKHSSTMCEVPRCGKEKAKLRNPSLKTEWNWYSWKILSKWYCIQKLWKLWKNWRNDLPLFVATATPWVLRLTMSTYHRGPLNLIFLVENRQPMVREDGHPKLPDITAWKLDRDRWENRWISNIKMIAKKEHGNRQGKEHSPYTSFFWWC